MGAGLEGAGMKGGFMPEAQGGGFFSPSLRWLRYLGDDLSWQCSHFYLG